MKTASRLIAGTLAAATLTLTAAGVASATEQTPQDVPVWLIPGADLGSLLGPTTTLPEALAPVFGLLTLLGA